MVSLRRRRLLGLCTGISGEHSNPVELPEKVENSNPPETRKQETKPPSIDPLQDNASTKEPSPLQVNNTDVYPVSSNLEQSHYFPGKQIKRRKRHRRKFYQDQEPCVMRGVYFKNMKWQAAIKVEKKQIHLGTVESQEEAARLYDRAAYMCGREPNFELAEEEKQELSKYDWNEFLAVTRSKIITKKKASRGKKPGPLSKQIRNDDYERLATSASEVEHDAYNS